MEIQLLEAANYIPFLIGMFTSGVFALMAFFILRLCHIQVSFQKYFWKDFKDGEGKVLNLA